MENNNHNAGGHGGGHSGGGRGRDGGFIYGYPLYPYPYPYCLQDERGNCVSPFPTSENVNEKSYFRADNNNMNMNNTILQPQANAINGSNPVFTGDHYKEVQKTASVLTAYLNSLKASPDNTLGDYATVNKISLKDFTLPKNCNLSSTSTRKDVTACLNLVNKNLYHSRSKMLTGKLILLNDFILQGGKTKTFGDYLKSKDVTPEQFGMGMPDNLNTPAILSHTTNDIIPYIKATNKEYGKQFKDFVNTAPDNIQGSVILSQFEKPIVPQKIKKVKTFNLTAALSSGSSSTSKGNPTGGKTTKGGSVNVQAGHGTKAGGGKVVTVATTIADNINPTTLGGGGNIIIGGSAGIGGRGGLGGGGGTKPGTGGSVNVQAGHGTIDKTTGATTVTGKIAPQISTTPGDVPPTNPPIPPITPPFIPIIPVGVDPGSVVTPSGGGAVSPSGGGGGGSDSGSTGSDDGGSMVADEQALDNGEDVTGYDDSADIGDDSTYEDDGSGDTESDVPVEYYGFNFKEMVNSLSANGGYHNSIGGWLGGIVKGAGKDANNVGKGIGKAASDVGKDVSKAATDISKDAGNILHVVNEYDPVFVLIRACIGGCFDINFINLATNLSKVKALKDQSHWNKITQTWTTIGGNPTDLGNMITRGAGKKAFFYASGKRYQGADGDLGIPNAFAPSDNSQTPVGGSLPSTTQTTEEVGAGAGVVAAGITLATGGTAAPVAGGAAAVITAMTPIIADALKAIPANQNPKPDGSKLPDQKTQAAVTSTTTGISKQTSSIMSDITANKGLIIGTLVGVVLLIGVVSLFGKKKNIAQAA